MGGAGGVVHEKGLAGSSALLVVHPGNRIVDQVAVEQVVVRATAAIHRGRAIKQRRLPLIGVARNKAVEVLEAPPRRPLLKRARR